MTVNRPFTAVVHRTLQKPQSFVLSPARLRYKTSDIRENDLGFVTLALAGGSGPINRVAYPLGPLFQFPKRDIRCKKQWREFLKC